MSNHARADDEAEELRSEPSLPSAVESTETYETDEGTVFYDAENPMAWIQAESPVALDDVA
ncbi:DUF7331 family protein [Halomicrobium urmianum]|uniref:DUF7331 family protein n=1 Tax=Halomicrobium urmianum TaxID=1586233 RepID=UPI001CD9E2CE|nr:hypothetical protein [Halomicrobium urmianum]